MRRMILLVTLPLVVALGFSCGKTKEKVNEATEFDMDYSTQLSIPSTSITVTAPADFTTPEISTESAPRFTQEKTTQDLIDEVKLTKFDISNPNGNLDYLKAITVFIKSGNLGEVQIASKSNIPAGTKSIGADLTGANIKEFLFREKFQFRVSVTISTGLSADQTLKIDQTMRVKGRKI
jgi:hypothetical protein